jgi:CysZ protein
MRSVRMQDTGFVVSFTICLNAMSSVIASFMRAFGDLFARRIIGLLLLPPLGSLALWGLLTWFFWDHWKSAVLTVLSTTTVAGWLDGWGATWVIDYASAMAVLVTIIPLAYITALVITEIWVMPKVLAFVAGRHFPQLARRHGGTLSGSLLNSLAGIAVFAMLWILTLPLWLTGAGAVLAPVLTSAYLMQRVFRYDCVAEHASGEELDVLARRGRGERYVLGVALSLLLYVPVLNLAVPVLAALAYTHFGLNQLEIARTSR